MLPSRHCWRWQWHPRKDQTRGCWTNIYAVSKINLVNILSYSHIGVPVEHGTYRALPCVRPWTYRGCTGYTGLYQVLSRSTGMCREPDFEILRMFKISKYDSRRPGSIFYRVLPWFYRVLPWIYRECTGFLPGLSYLYRVSTGLYRGLPGSTSDRF